MTTTRSPLSSYSERGFDGIELPCELADDYREILRAWANQDGLHLTICLDAPMAKDPQTAQDLTDAVAWTMSSNSPERYARLRQRIVSHLASGDNFGAHTFVQAVDRKPDRTLERPKVTGRRIEIVRIAWDGETIVCGVRDDGNGGEPTTDDVRMLGCIYFGVRRYIEERTLS